MWLGVCCPASFQVPVVDMWELYAMARTCELRDRVGVPEEIQYWSSRETIDLCVSYNLRTLWSSESKPAV